VVTRLQRTKDAIFKNFKNENYCYLFTAVYCFELQFSTGWKILIESFLNDIVLNENYENSKLKDYMKFKDSITKNQEVVVENIIAEQIKYLRQILPKNYKIMSH